MTSSIPNDPLRDDRPENRRTGDRIDAEFEITAQSENNFYQGLTENISVGGLFFETYVPHRLGEHLRVRFSLPGGDAPVEVDCEVRWIRAANPVSDTPQGIGVQFVALDPEARRLIERFTRKRDPLFFEGG